MDGRGALGVCFEEGVDSVKAFDHVLDDQEIFALEGGSLDFQSDQEGLDIFCGERRYREFAKVEPKDFVDLLKVARGYLEVTRRLEFIDAHSGTFGDGAFGHGLFYKVELYAFK